MKKTILKIFVVVIMTILFVNTITFSNNITNTTKKVIGIVYDDSWSMVSNGEDYAYANYAVQNIIAFMNETDELFVVKMSDKYNFETIDVKSKNVKASNILETEKWDSFADETPFEAVETAIEHMKDLKSIYGTNDNTEYFLIVLTDGGFEGMPSDLTSYLNNVSDFMSDVLYESIWICVGSKNTYNSLISKLDKVNKTRSISTANKDGISKALFDTIQIIYGRVSKKDKDITGTNKQVSFTYDYPIKKIIVYEQDQNVSLDTLRSSDGKTYKPFVSYTTNKSNQSGKLKLTSNIIEITDNEQSIKEGRIELNFDEEIDSQENKLQIIVEPAVSLDLYPINENGEKQTDLSKYLEGDIVEFVAVPVNLYTNELVDINNNINNILSKYTYNGKTEKLEFDPNIKTYKFTTVLKTGSNSFSASIELPGYFKVNSNVTNIYVPLERYIIPNLSKDNIKIGNTLEKKFENIDSVEYNLENLENKSNGTLEFSNVPKGIQFKVNGNNVKNNRINLSLNEKNDIEILRNRDYKEDKAVTIAINVDFDDINIKLRDKGVRLTVEPLNRVVSIQLDKLYEDDNDLNSGNAYNKNIYKLTPIIDGVNISKEELDKSSISIFNQQDKVKWKTKKVEENGQNFIYIYLDNSLNPFDKFKSKTINAELLFKTAFGEEINENVSFTIEANFLSALIGILLLFFIILCIIGWIVKPRLDVKNHKIIIKSDSKIEYEGPIYADGGLNKILPFIAEKGTANGLKVKASNDKKQIIILKQSLSENMEYDMVDVNIQKDLAIYEETVLIKKEGRSKKLTYVYHDVNKDIEDEPTDRSKRRVRRRR